ncbi:MAG: hypothetical protein LBQ87_06845 [Candidatus Fibromonas sp.]|nr:hypothetical protein [Candidatus Fibromonas sp.]
MRKVFLILSLYCAGFADNMPYLVLGPNIEYGIFGAAAPAGVRGVFVPQANASFDFFWLEPLGADYYGIRKSNKTNYIKFFAGAELSPFYGTIRAGLGVAPLPPPLAILELRFVYSNENLFWSDVEMPMKSDEHPGIKYTWDAGYIFDSFYRRSSYAQMQSYDVQLVGEYISKTVDVFFSFNYALIDINSNYDKKSFDYMRGIPLYSRDYIASRELSVDYHFDGNFSWNLELLYVTSGTQLGFFSTFKTYDKELLSYYLISTGPLWKFNGGRSCLSLSPGFFGRDNDNHTFSDSVKERIILSVQFRHFWDFNFGK